MGYLPLLQWLQRQAEAGPRPAPDARFGDGGLFAHGEGDEVSQISVPNCTIFLQKWPVASTNNHTNNRKTVRR